LEQLASYAKEQIQASDVTSLLGVTESEALYEFTSMLIAGDLSTELIFLEKRIAEGHDIRQFVLDLLGYLRDLYLFKSLGDIRSTALSEEMRERLEEQVASVNSRSLLFYINSLNDLFNQSRWSTDIRLQLEITLFKMIKTGDDVTLEGLLHRIERLENALMSGGFTKTPSKTAEAKKKTPMSSAPKDIELPAQQDAGPKEVVWTKPSTQKSDEDSGKSGTAAESILVITEVKGEIAPGKKTLPEPVYLEDDSSSKTNSMEEDTGPETGAVDLEAINRYWPQVMKLIKDKKRARYHFFAAAKVKRVEDGKLVLTMKSAERQFIENPENLQLLRNALKIASGIDIPILCETERENVKTVAVTDVAKTSTAKDDFEDEVFAIGDYIKMVQDTFGAKIVQDITLDD
jgi:DNA polymerase III gamma/tau subunit